MIKDKTNEIDNANYEQTSINTKSLDKMFYDVEEYCDKFNNLLKEFEIEFEQISIFNRSKAKKDFEQEIGLSISELEKATLEINQIWKDIKRYIAIKNFDSLDKALRTFTYNDLQFRRCLLSFEKYDLLSRKYIKDKDKIVKLTDDIRKVTKELDKYLTHIFSILEL
ncbi:hypothetical protein GC105_01625 [Alkalibaculum sp. M08DMB]|uniref:Uncharacterized protein n=1 Tax=Alkalibaculum sporogenes TaxID=2655001 RepID=A0A6A7K5S2_9FIRM|nr:hypothetical protein [Alkalibaculum sporogenes]MPW24493.1 hypothetical protein [Alkalibaculum sporogenes]